MFKTELQKLFRKRLVQVLIVVILLGNGILGYINANVNVKATEANAKSYVALQQDLASLSEKEKVAYISEGIAYMLVMQSAQIYATFGYDATDEAFFYAEHPDYSLAECIEVYEKGSYLRYTTNMFSERKLYEEVQEEMEVCNTYSSYVARTLDRTLFLLKKTKNQDSYTFRNLAEMYFAFEVVKDVETSYGPSRGVQFLCNNLTTDLWVLLFIFMISVLLVTTEREKNLLILVKSTRHGRSKLGATKLLVLYIGCLITMSLHIENFILANEIYGIGDLGRSIQSVVGYQGCTLPVSVGEFLLLCFCLKLLVYLMCASFIYAVCAFSMKSVWVYVITIGVAVVSGLVYFNIDSNASIALLKDVTPMALLKVNDILGVYKNLQLGNYALNRLLVAVVLVLLICIISSVVAIIAFAVRNEKQSQSKSVLIPIWKNVLAQINQKISAVMEKHTNSLRHEWYKVFRVQHVFFILLFSGLFVYKTFEPMNAISSSDEVYYETFISNVTGPATEVSDEYWEALEQQYNEIHANASMEDDFQKIQSVKDALNVIEKLKEHGQYLATKPESWYLYDIGYGVLTDSDRSYEKTEQSSVLFLILIGVFCFVGMYSFDYQNDGIRLLRTTKYGRGILTANKLFIGTVLAVVISAFAWLPQLLYTLGIYGTEAIEAPAYSMQHLSWVSQWISIKEYLILIYVVRFVGMITMMLLVFAITIRLRSFIVSTCIALAVTLLPVGLHMLGVDFMKYVLLTPMLMGNPMFVSGKLGIVVICLIQEVVILGVSIGIINYK